MTDNYGQAGAIELLGHGLLPVYSGHNAYGEWGPPPDDKTAVVLVTQGTPGPQNRFWSALGACQLKATIGNSAGVENDELGTKVYVCPQIAVPWSRSWPQMEHLD
jgi:hypothetical protein